MKKVPALTTVILALHLLLSTGCTRSWLIYTPPPPDQIKLSSVAVIPIQLELQERGIGNLTGTSENALDRFRETLTESAIFVVEEMGARGIRGVGQASTLTIAEQRNLVFESALERSKVLLDLDLQESFTWYARRIARPALKSLASANVVSHASKIGASALLIMRFKAVKLSGAEYWREWIRALLITGSSIFLDTTLAHRSYITGDVLIIDGITGRGLFYNRAVNFAGAPDNAEDTKDLFRELLAPLQDNLL